MAARAAAPSLGGFDRALSRVAGSRARGGPASESVQDAGWGMDADDHGAAQAPAADQRVPWGELWRWFAPWLGGAALVALSLLGLFVASRAEDDTTYAGGFAAAVGAAVALGWRIRGGFRGRRGDAALPVLVDDGEALVVLVAVLVVLGVLGLFLAARGEQPMAIYGGYGLFLAALVMIFWNVKHYFDRLER